MDELPWDANSHMQGPRRPLPPPHRPAEMTSNSIHSRLIVMTSGSSAKDPMNVLTPRSGHLGPAQPWTFD